MASGLVILTAFNRSCNVRRTVFYVLSLHAVETLPCVVLCVSAQLLIQQLILSAIANPQLKKHCI